MFPTTLHLGASFEAFSLNVTVPTAGLLTWFDQLRARNAVSRGLAEAAPGICYRDVCPGCQAGPSALTHVETEEGTSGSCLVCRAVFPLGADA